MGTAPSSSDSIVLILARLAPQSSRSPLAGAMGAILPSAPNVVHQRESDPGEPLALDCTYSEPNRPVGQEDQSSQLLADTGSFKAL